VSPLFPLPLPDILTLMLISSTPPLLLFFLDLTLRDCCFPLYAVALLIFVLRLGGLLRGLLSFPLSFRVRQRYRLDLIG